MGVTDFLHFDQSKYRQKISRPHYSDQELQENIYTKRREISASGWGIGAGLALIPPTLGASALGAGVASRSLIIARDKLSLLEMEWQRRGYAPLQVHHFRDGALPCVFAAAVGGATLGMDHGLAVAGANAISHAGYVGAQQLANGVIQGQGLPPGSEAAFGSGFVNGAHQVGTAFQGTPNFGLAPPPMNPMYAVGQMAGVSAAEHAAGYAIQQGANWMQNQTYHNMRR
ncbi:hypothetical protein SCHPADRAFT_944877 [Schizopora paradoxa]|uniref:Uncharacterized protein n=1 Tax=Schizopora paradoxa TaxID=27342 RepID=A0A0H2REI8_9AGAM|nr:hypothetical protein SCHPADRAFT_944877 [Schizopora paradoxa]